MTTAFLLAPGPSANQALADRLNGKRVGVCTSAFPLFPEAEFLAATDLNFWLRYPGAKKFAGRKFTTNRITGIERLTGAGLYSDTNSGVLGLEAWRQIGATRVVMLGFDFGLGHYFGKYPPGLVNTKPTRRPIHAQQFRRWQKIHGRAVEVLNATKGTELTVFPLVDIEEALSW